MCCASIKRHVLSQSVKYRRGRPTGCAPDESWAPLPKHLSLSLSLSLSLPWPPPPLPPPPPPPTFYLTTLVQVAEKK